MRSNKSNKTKKKASRKTTRKKSNNKNNKSRTTKAAGKGKAKKSPRKASSRRKIPARATKASENVAKKSTLGSDLEPQQLRFITEYLKDFNGTQAGIRAGYSKNTAAQQASRLLRNVKVQQQLQQQAKAVLERIELEAADVVEELRKIGFSDFGDYAQWGPKGLTLRPSHPGLEEEDGLPALPKGASKIIQEVTERVNKGGYSLSIKLHDKLGALNALGKYFGLFKEQKEISGTLSLEQKPGIDWEKLTPEERRIMRKALQRELAGE